MSLAPLNPIQMLPARDRVAAALREAILSHQFSEGEKGRHCPRQAGLHTGSVRAGAE